MRFLVTGATGNVGRSVVASLLTQGHEVRALTRIPSAAEFPADVEVRAGSVSDPDALRAALEHVDGVFLNVFGNLDAVATSVRSAGTPHTVLLSSITAATRPELIHASEFRALEDALADAAPALTVLRPGAFMSNLLWWKPELQHGDTVAAMSPDVPAPLIAPEDVGTIAGRALGDALGQNTPLALLGTELLSQRAQLEQLARHLDRPLHMVAVDAAEYGSRHPELDDPLIEYLHATLGAPTPEESQPSDLAALLGREPLRLADWIRQHSSEFTARHPGSGRA